MFKKSVITDEISQDFMEAVQLAKKYRLDAVEIRSVWEKNPDELDLADITRMKAILKEADMSVSAISAPFFKCDIDSEEDYKNHLELLKKCISLSQELGTRLIRGFTFWSKGNIEDYLDRIVEKFREPARILEEADCVLVIEPDPSVFASNARLVRTVLERLNTPFIRGLWDPGNDIFDPLKENPFPDGYEQIRPFMVHMHLKDAKILDGKVQSVPIGTGAVNYKEHFERLILDGYEGYVTLETHYRPKHELGKTLLEMPKGSAFSWLGYEATEECLINWEKLTDEISQGND